MANVLERGDIFFLYRPKVQTEAVHGLEDVQRFYIVLKPSGRELYRRIVIGRKYLSDIEDKERNWGFVDKVMRSPEELDEDLDPHVYRTRTRGERWQPAARPAGEGVYAIVLHDNHTHLAYKLELPRKTGEAQEELNIESEASFVITVKNPEAGSPPATGLTDSQTPFYPQHLQERFRGRRFIDVDPPEFLDYEGSEMVLIGASQEAQKDLGVALRAEPETEKTADTFTKLHLDRDKHPVEPLTKGELK